MACVQYIAGKLNGDIRESNLIEVACTIPQLRGKIYRPTPKLGRTLYDADYSALDIPMT
ncbi:hypothetical protein D3C81_1768620 [compost metagenome]